MGLIIEIGLTFAAWKRGWRAKALLPLGIGLPIAFLFGMMIGASVDGEEDFPYEAFLLIDLLMIIVLIIMIAKPPAVQERELAGSAKNFCPQCGSSIVANSKYCATCGQSFQRYIF